MSDDDDVGEVEVEPEARGVRFRFDQGLESFDSVDKETTTTAVAIVESERERSVDQLSEATDFGVLIFEEISDEGSFSGEVEVDDGFGGAGSGVDWRGEEVWKRVPRRIVVGGRRLNICGCNWQGQARMMTREG
jgi:hypothetical protein